LSTRPSKYQPFHVGDYCTIADIGCWGRMVFMSEGGFEIADWPHLEAWARTPQGHVASNSFKTGGQV
jgi:hypothetical protein